MQSDRRAPDRGGIPRLSRLPMPRASTDNLNKLRPVASRGGLNQDFAPKSVGSATLSPSPAPVQKFPSPLGEASYNSTKTRFGWPNQASRERSSSPVRDALLQTSNNFLETTPPRSTTETNGILVDADENAVEGSLCGIGTPLPDKGPRNDRKPRPSLSERTTETLSQLPPSPSPSRRRSSIFSNDTVMGPPSRPASAMRTTRRNTAEQSRTTSPTKPSFRPPGPVSPKKAIGAGLSDRAMPSIYTPPKAFVRDDTSRIAKPMREIRRSISTTFPETSHALSHSKAQPLRNAYTVRIKTGGSLAEKAPSQPKPSSSSASSGTPKQVPRTKSSKSELSVPNSSPSLLRPRSRGENSLAPSSAAASSATASSTVSTPSRVSNNTITGVQISPEDAPKSSSVLRATIAEAKAQARRARLQKQNDPSSKPENHLNTSISSGQAHVSGSSSLVLKSRIEAARNSGDLNISAMGLKNIPDVVLHMYDFDPSTAVDWSASVDLVKLIAADNEMTELRDDAFPDWSTSEMEQDDSKCIQFGGLKKLDFHGNLLRTLPLGLRRLERLSILNLSNNRLHMDSLDIVCQLASLGELYISSNQLSGRLTAAIGNLESLRILDLRSNALEELPDTVGNLKNLQRLRLSENKIASLPFQALAMLPLLELSVSKNRLHGCLLPEVSTIFKTLRHLDVSFNDLEMVSSSSSFPTPALQHLAVDGNRLSTLPDVSKLSDMLTLTASENLLTELPQGFSSLFNLKSANLSRNQIRLVPQEIALMENLNSLELASNPLRDRKYLTMKTEQLKDDLLKRLDNDEVSTAGNANFDVYETAPSRNAGIPSTSLPTTAGQVFRYCPKEGILDLSSLEYSSLVHSTIDLRSPVTTLKLSSASLSTLPISLLEHPSIQDHLQNLDLSHNPLSPTEYLCNNLYLPKLLSLCIVSTGMTSLTPLETHLSAPNLHTLNISCHRLTGALPQLRRQFPKLTTLLATDNWFTSVGVSAVRGLEILDIRNNEVDRLVPHIGMLGNKEGQAREGRLRSLEVSGNKFRVPSWQVVERGTEAILKDLRRMIPLEELDEEWRDGV